MKVTMSAEQRDRGLNASRGLAVLSILTAQLTPDAGPFRVLMYAEFLPPALLAVLIGMTAQVAREHGAPAIVNLLWGAALIVLGALISLLPGDVVPLLGYLGCLAVVTTVLVRIPVPALAGSGLALLAIAPWATARLAHLHSDGSTALSGSWVDRRLLDLLDVLAGDSPYRVLALTTYAIAGVLLVRLVDTPDTHGMVVGAALVVAMGVDAVSQAGGPVLRFGVGTVQELSFNTAVAVAIA
ncbi:MAG: putative rane protein YeiB, partial [Nocardioidaceae bacterium]|nr:putative rane protein YeiB [Nocardioidaceae bacterium]